MSYPSIYYECVLTTYDSHPFATVPRELTYTVRVIWHPQYIPTAQNALEGSRSMQDERLAGLIRFHLVGHGIGYTWSLKSYKDVLWL